MPCNERLMTIALAALLLTAGADAQAASCGKQSSAARQLACQQPNIARALQQQARRSLRDPEGARIRDAKLYESDDGAHLAVCGVLNAKNGYGAFVGETPFISTSTGLVRLAEEEPQAFETLWAMFCSKPFR